MPRRTQSSPESLFRGGQRRRFQAATKHLLAADRQLARAIEAIGPCSLAKPRAKGAFAALAEAIIYQQLRGRAAETIFSRLVALLEGRLEPAAVRALSPAALKGAGVSQGKAAALLDLAAHFESAELPELEVLSKLPDEEIVERLTKVRGIGPWTAEMFLIFRLGRPDVFPATDYGVRSGFSVLTRSEGLPAPRALLEHAERWRPYRSVAAWYLWRVVERAKAGLWV